jgi:ribosomal protein S18 acetylase RimI-like enzyme
MVEFKKIELGDLKKVREIAYKTWPDTFGQIMPAEQINYMLGLIYHEDSLRKQIVEKNHNFLLVENDNQSLGFASYEISYNSQPQLMIHKIYLLPATQGMGIGTKLLNLLSEIALQNSNFRLRLKVYVANRKAIAFYEKYGFKKTGTETTYIGNGYSAADNIMVKELQ